MSHKYNQVQHYFYFLDQERCPRAAFFTLSLILQSFFVMFCESGKQRQDNNPGHNHVLPLASGSSALTQKQVLKVIQFQ